MNENSVPGLDKTKSPKNEKETSQPAASMFLLEGRLNFCLLFAEFFFGQTTALKDHRYGFSHQSQYGADRSSTAKTIYT